MKNLIFLLLLLMFSCGNLKKQLQSSEEKYSETQKEVEKWRKKYDSMVHVYQKEIREIKQETTSNNWEYSAPPLLPGVKPDTVRVTEPIWMRVNGEMVNLAQLPPGSTFSSSSQVQKLTEYYRNEVQRMERVIADLKAQKQSEAKIQYIDRDRLVEVERQTVSWMLVCAALVLGIFIPDVFRWGKKLIFKI